MFVGGGVVALILVGLLIFLGVKALGGDEDPPTTQPTTSTQPSGEPTGQPSGEPTGQPSGEPTNSGGGLGEAKGQAKTATEKMQAVGYQCSDLFNGAEGAHRGCFKFEDVTEAEAIFQFQPDGTIIGVLIQSRNSENVNNAAVTFDAALQAIGNDTFGGSEVAKIQQAVKTGQKNTKVGSAWGEFTLRNNGDTLQISGGKSGSDSYDLPRKEFPTTEAEVTAALKAKQYNCTTSCRKTLGKYGSQSVFAIGSNKGGIRSIEFRASGDPNEVKAAMPVVLADGMAALKGPDVAAIKTFIEAHKDGKPYAGYVAGWRVQATGTVDQDYSSQRIEIRYESYYV